jgi:hypothetical protein
VEKGFRDEEEEYSSVVEPERKAAFSSPLGPLSTSGEGKC